MLAPDYPPPMLQEELPPGRLPGAGQALSWSKGSSCFFLFCYMSPPLALDLDLDLSNGARIPSQKVAVGMK